MQDKEEVWERWETYPAYAAAGLGAGAGLPAGRLAVVTL
ncbi:MAG: hypothetical protein JWN03_8054 [Nocardia sp.]|nr:hypothetical protein [Nocardia sp.]